MAKFEYDREAWIEEQNEKLNNLHNEIKSLAENYQQNPETIAELMEFQSRFYQYSMKNSILIKNQNSNSVLVSSYKDWMKKGYKVQKGSKGIAIFVPSISEVFKPINGEKYKKVSQATPEEKQLIENKTIKVNTSTNFRIGYVFDIAQTDCPEKDYPRFYSMGYSSEQHSKLYDGIKEYSNSIGVPVYENDLQSIALRGRYFYVLNEIEISDKLNDTEKLSTLTHELGHAIMHKYNDKIPSDVKEYEADCISIMLQSHLGIKITESRKSHLASHYRELGEKFSFDESLKRVNKTYNTIISEVEQFISPEQLEKEYHNTPKESIEVSGEYILAEDKKQFKNQQDKDELVQYYERQLEKVIKFYEGDERKHGYIEHAVKNLEEVKKNGYIDWGARKEVDRFTQHKPQTKIPKYSKEENDALYQNIKQNIDIVELARELGYTPVKEGSLYTLKEHDSLKLYPSTNSFTRFKDIQSNGKYSGGSVIDLVMQLNNVSMQESIEYLKQKVISPSFNEIRKGSCQETCMKTQPPKPFQLPPKVDGKHSRVFAYLTKTRAIEPQIVSEMMKKEHIYEDDKHNAVFCGKDENGEIVYATKKSTNTKSAYRGDVSGSRQEVGVFVDNKAATMVVNEAFIDSMSYMTLMKMKGKDYTKLNFLALNGISGKPILHHLKENPNINKVILALDNDDGGKDNTNRIKPLIKELAKESNRIIEIVICTPHEKDFNEDLKKVIKLQEKKLNPSNVKIQQYEMER